MRTGWKVVGAVALLLAGGLALAAAALPRADEVLSAAKTQAATERKNIFLTFGASWCEPCHRLEAFLNAADIAPLLQKYFVFAKLNVAEEHGEHPDMESPGAEKMLKELGGDNDGVPFIFFLDAQGSKLVDSHRPVHGTARFVNIGYPDTPQEIFWFMEMLKRGAPRMTEEERRVVGEKLRAAGRN
ncbi:MAG: thioredoxin family protein [Candidatus Acidiferrum sp.]|jgi:thiol-disulfide isomerase/thioredoxin